ncbi:hypothetical protein HY750_01635 [Candidatus Kuenenbacteria bacterium]|nr:hypothetical protein [Candidatus Kuenenbacteria bacterium]
MSKKFATIFLSLFLLSFVFILIPVQTNADILGIPLSSDCLSKGDCTLCDVIKIAVGIAGFILKIVGVLALALFIWGGFGLIISAGNEEKVKKNKGILVGTLVGIIIILVAWQMVWLTVATLITPPGTTKNGLKILKYKDWSDWSGVCNKSKLNTKTGEKEETKSPAVTQPGTVQRGEECSTTIENKKCDPKFICAKHWKINKYICINPGAYNPGQSCIPNNEKRECKNNHACHNEVPIDCEIVIECGKCQ